MIITREQFLWHKILVWRIRYITNQPKSMPFKTNLRSMWGQVDNNYVISRNNLPATGEAQKHLNWLIDAWNGMVLRLKTIKKDHSDGNNLTQNRWCSHNQFSHEPLHQPGWKFPMRYSLQKKIWNLTQCVKADSIYIHTTKTRLWSLLILPM